MRKKDMSLQLRRILALNLSKLKTLKHLGHDKEQLHFSQRLSKANPLASGERQKRCMGTWSEFTVRVQPAFRRETPRVGPVALVMVYRVMIEDDVGIFWYFVPS